MRIKKMWYPTGLAKEVFQEGLADSPFGQDKSDDDWEAKTPGPGERASQEEPDKSGFGGW